MSHRIKGEEERGSERRSNEGGEEEDGKVKTMGKKNHICSSEVLYYRGVVCVSIHGSFVKM